MTIKATIECDAGDCSRELDIDDADSTTAEFEIAGWVEDPEYGWHHFCPTCWPVVKKEREEESHDNER